MKPIILGTAFVGALLASPLSVADFCDGLPDHAALTVALKTALPEKAGGNNAAPFTNGGGDFPMWATVVGRDGTVCAVTRSADGFDAQWLASRPISCQKAYGTNSLTTDATFATGLGLWSSARLYTPTQPEGSLYGLQESNPVNAAVVYKGPAKRYGTTNDFLVGKKCGGINVFGGALALFDEAGKVIGAVGVSGDTSCADHNIAWRVRQTLGLALDGTTDNIVYDINDEGKSTSGFGHPTCGFDEVNVNEAITGVDQPADGPN